MDNKKAVKLIAGFKEDVRVLREREDGLKFGLKHFEIPLVQLKDLTDVEAEIELLEQIWGIKDRWDKQWDIWKNMKFLDLDTEFMTDQANDYNKKV
jgi:dynein heavy chain